MAAVKVAGPSSLPDPVAESDDDEDQIGPQPVAPAEEPEYDPDEIDEGGGNDETEAPQFPTTHELILKDHTKVVSALALDPSGARIVSGSHDYDCKLWDFGGMDMRCKPFKSWEPSGSYHVGLSFVSIGLGRLTYPVTDP